MRRGLILSGLLVLWAAVSLGIASQWMAHPQWFPPLPEALWRWMRSRYETQNAEQVADMEFITVLAISAGVSLAAMLGFVAARRQSCRLVQR